MQALHFHVNGMSRSLSRVEFRNRRMSRKRNASKTLSVSLMFRFVGN
jgi:hypothetical protein